MEQQTAAETSFRIRPPRLEDVEALNAIRRQPGVASWTLGLPTERVEHNRQFLESAGPDDHLLVAEVDGQVVALAGLHLKRGKMRHAGTIGIMVDERYHNRGIGRALMEALLDLADNWLGLVRVELEVFAGNDNAIHLYRSLGFEEEGLKRKDVFRQGRYWDVVIMGRVR